MFDNGSEAIVAENQRFQASIVEGKMRFGPKFGRAMARNPLVCIPEECFDHHVVRGWGPVGRAFHVTQPEMLADILVRKADFFQRPDIHRRVLQPALGGGLLTSEDLEWRRQRKVCAPAFQPSQLAALTPPMLAAARLTRNRWSSFEGVRLDLDREMMETTLRIILNTVLSTEPGLDVPRFGQALSKTLQPTGWKLLAAMMRLPEALPYPGRLAADRSTAYLRRVTADLVDREQDAEAKRTTLLTLLREAKDPDTGLSLSPELIVDNLLTFIAAGHETTALGLVWTFHLLATHLEVRDRLESEIDRVVGPQNVLPEHLAALPYLKQVFLEAMRLFPPAPMIVRAVRKRTSIGGISFEIGEIIAIPIYAVHRHRQLWSDPESFDPSRFSQQEAARRHRFSYLPFGGGPHICIGSGFAMQEAMAILAVLIQTFRIEAVEEKRPVEPVMKVTLRTKNKLRVRVFERRSRAANGFPIP